MYRAFPSLEVICKAAAQKTEHAFIRHYHVDKMASAEAAFGRQSDAGDSEVLSLGQCDLYVLEVRTASLQGPPENKCFLTISFLLGDPGMGQSYPSI